METLTAKDGGRFDAYVALPATGRGPGVVVLQEIFGVNDVMRAVCDELAVQGFVAICPDLFWRQEPGIVLTDRTEAEWARAFELYQGLDVDLAIDDAAATLDWLREQSSCTGKVGAIGFCLGGKLAYLLAARHAPDAAIGYYGVGIEESLDEAGGIARPLMLHLAGADEYCDEAARASIHSALDDNAQLTLHDYPDVGHAFMRPGGEHHDAAAAELAGLRSFAFLSRHLGGPAVLAGEDGAATRLSDLWDQHVRYEFETKDTEATLGTMREDAYVNHVPVLTGGVGKAELREFYANHFIPKMPPDTEMTPVSRTIGSDRVVDEMVFSFTHTIEMDWMLPGLAPTGKRVEIALVVIVHLDEGKLFHEHIYWDQASVLVQLGLIDAESLPVAGVQTARKVLDPSLPANELMRRT